MVMKIVGCVTDAPLAVRCRRTLRIRLPSRRPHHRVQYLVTY